MIKTYSKNMQEEVTVYNYVWKNDTVHITVSDISNDIILMLKFINK